MDFKGEFETHLTVQLRDSQKLDELREWGQRHGLTCLHIVLDRGDCVSQPMLSRHGIGTLPTELALAKELAHQLRTLDFKVSRIKLEANPENEDVPHNDADAIRFHESRYFEHHVKLLLVEDAGLTPIVNLAERHATHLSRNALRLRHDGRQERFVTQRCHRAGLLTARRRLQALREDLLHLRPQILDVEQEYVVHDSNLAIDAGWLPKE